MWERAIQPPTPTTIQIAIVSHRPRLPVTAAASVETTAATGWRGTSRAKINPVGSPKQVIIRFAPKAVP
jgi:hypothetical protein